MLLVHAPKKGNLEPLGGGMLAGARKRMGALGRLAGLLVLVGWLGSDWVGWCGLGWLGVLFVGRMFGLLAG